jgi:hypothetical protein
VPKSCVTPLGCRCTLAVVQTIFEKYGLHPQASPEEITTLMRHKMDAEDDPTERDAIQAAWQKLLRHPKERLLEAFLTPPAPALEAVATLPRKKVLRKPTPREHVQLVDCQEPSSSVAAEIARVLSLGQAGNRLLFDDSVLRTLLRDEGGMP